MNCRSVYRKTYIMQLCAVLLGAHPGCKGFSYEGNRRTYTVSPSYPARLVVRFHIINRVRFFLVGWKTTYCVFTYIIINRERRNKCHNMFVNVEWPLISSTLIWSRRWNFRYLWNPEGNYPKIRLSMTLDTYWAIFECRYNLNLATKRNSS